MFGASIKVEAARCRYTWHWLCAAPSGEPLLCQEAHAERVMTTFSGIDVGGWVAALRLILQRQREAHQLAQPSGPERRQVS